MTVDPDLYVRLRTLDPAGRRTVLHGLPTPLTLPLDPAAGKAVLDGVNLSAGTGIDLRKADLRAPACGVATCPRPIWKKPT